MSTPTSIHVYDLSGGHTVAAIYGTFTDSVVLSSSLLAALVLPSTNRLYDLRTGGEVAMIRHERVIAILDRRIFSLSRNRLVVRLDAGLRHLVAVLGGGVVWSELQGSKLYWLELRYPSYWLRTLDLASVK